jgi:hypothetical protein
MMHGHEVVNEIFPRNLFFLLRALSRLSAEETRWVSWSRLCA